MDIAALKAFITVAEARSFSLAAERLFLTQPAVSKRIAGLESELDTRLFDRIGRTVTLTESGRALLPRAQRILIELEDSARAIANLSGKIHGTLRFARPIRRLVALLIKEFIQMRRDRITFGMMLGVPLLQLVVFGYAINNELHSFALEVNSRSQTFANRFFASYNRFRDFRDAFSEPFPTIDIGPLTIRVFGLMVALGMIVGILVAARRNERFGVPRG